MNITKEKVTPKKAMEWLKRNVNNRPLSQSHVKRLAGAMTAGRWRLNGDTIRFNGNGDLIDGQHRLQACAVSGLDFEAYVVRGLEHEAFNTIDQNKVRSGGDVFARMGEKHYSLLAAATGIVHYYLLTGTVDTGAAVRIDELESTLEQHPGLRDAVVFFVRHKGKKVIPGSCGSALLYLFRQVDTARADLFWDRIMTGEGLTREMAEYRLRDRLLANLAATAKLRRRDICALSIKAWNFARAGKCPKALAFFDREEFPKIQ